MRIALVALSPLAGAPHFRDPVGVPAGRYTLYAKRYVQQIRGSETQGRASSPMTSAVGQRFNYLKYSRTQTAGGVCYSEALCAQLSSDLSTGARRWLDGDLDVE